MSKNRKKVIAITLDPELHEWIKGYAESRKTNVSRLISDFVFELSSSTASKSTPNQ